MPPPQGSEYSFLENQAADAKTAMIRTLESMKATVGEVTDLRPFVRPRPLLVGVSALAVGFVVGTVMGLMRRRMVKTPMVYARANGRAAYAYPERNKAAPKKSFLFAIAGPLLAAIVQMVVKNSMAESVYTAVPRRDEGLSRDDSTGSCI
jgi:hypothetical protein